MSITKEVRVRPVLLLELNEIPWRLLDWAIARKRWKHVERFFSRARTYTTISHDVGELSPWITWPSLHRGMNNTEHNIRYLGQDVATFRGVPLWEEYRSRGLSVGVFGSMQSWPPIAPGEGGFYVPDTFAHDAQCIPSYLEPLQQFNLDLVRKNGRVVRREGFSPKRIARLLPSLLKAKIRPGTALKILEQLVSERVDQVRLSRRPIFQTVLFWDVFKSLYNPTHPPVFSSFFTNHIAGVMHRYWDDVFPEDFPEKDPHEPHPYRATMEFSWDITDSILRDVLTFQRENPELLLVLATSMGQEAVHRDYEGYSAAVEQVSKLLACAGKKPEQYRQLLAMVPQIAVEIPDTETRKCLQTQLLEAKTVSEASLFRVEEEGKTLSITIVSPRKADVLAGHFTMPDRSGSSHRFSWEQAGIIMHEIEAGTAYHIPEGILAVVGHGVAPKDTREKLDLHRVKPFLLELGGVLDLANQTETHCA